MSGFTPSQFGQYRLIEKIAVGGMAELFRARIAGEEGFEKQVAVKKILPHLNADEEVVRFFIEEAKLAALLQHPNIIRVYDFGKIGETYFLSMEYLDGIDLKGLVDKSRGGKRPITIENSLYITAQICHGLAYAHQLKNLEGQPLNIIHRDISPQNIFITDDGQVKIIDFGIAKAAGQSTQTRAGIVKGKVAYMSPEQAEGKVIDHRSDLFSAGSLLYELVTGQRMFEGDSFQILAKVREARFEPPENITRNLPRKLNRILHRALAREASQRYQSGGEMADDIEDCLYRLSLRPSAQKLSTFVHSVLKDDVRVAAATKAAAATVAHPARDKDAKDAQTRFQPTVAITTKARPSSSERGPETVKAVASRHHADKPSKPSGKRKWIAVYGFVLIAIIGGVALLTLQSTNPGSLQNQPDENRTEATVPVSEPTVDKPTKTLNAEEKAAIEKYLAKAKQSLDDNRLTTPPQDCAYFYYNAVREIDPNHPAVRRGYHDIGTRYAALTEQALNNFKYVRAKYYVDTGLGVAPRHPRLLALRKEVYAPHPRRVFRGVRNVFK